MFVIETAAPATCCCLSGGGGGNNLLSFMRLVSGRNGFVAIAQVNARERPQDSLHCAHVWHIFTFVFAMFRPADFINNTSVL